MSTRQAYSIELINQQKKKKREEIRASKKRMQELTQQLFSPTQSDNKIDNFMQHVNMGIAAYDGIMTGVKILRRVQHFFNKKKKRS